MTAPRGTTVTVRFVNEDDRPKKWGVFWNEYQAGRTGRPKQRSRYFATQAEAEEIKQGVLAELAQPTPAVTAPVRTYRAADALAAFANDVWLPFVKARNAGATHRNYRDAFRNWIAPEAGHPRYPGLGNVLLRDDTLTTRTVVEYLEGLYAAGVSLSRRRRLKASLSACLAHARFVGLLTQANPCAQLGRKLRHKGEEVQEPEPNPFAPEEITAIFDQLNAVEELCWRAYFLWQYHIGSRPGEATAVKWDHLKLDLRRARIEKSYCAIDKIDKDTKTHEKRTVDLTAALVDVLLEWRVVQRETAFARGLKVPEYVFTTTLPARRAKRELTRITQSGNMRLVFERTMKACGITGHTPYDFRDSFATSHLVSGWDRKLAWVSKQLGHKTPLTTAKHYYAFRDTSATASFADEIGGWR